MLRDKQDTDTLATPDFTTEVLDLPGYPSVPESPFAPVSSFEPEPLVTPGQYAATTIYGVPDVTEVVAGAEVPPVTEVTQVAEMLPGQFGDSVLLQNEAADADADMPKRSFWSMGGKRTLPILAAVAVLGMLAGFVLSRFVVNPADAAANAAPPAPGLVTVPIELRALRNDVVIRGDVLFEGAADVRIETAGLTVPPVVTGHIPEVGTELEAGSVILEVAGRPVIALPGDLPAFRTLRVGMSGPDVVQLKQALTSLGIPVGDVNSDEFDTATAAAVAALYQRAGFPTPVTEGAEQRVRDAQVLVTQAQNALSAASSPNAIDIARADDRVRVAEQNSRQANYAFAQFLSDHHPNPEMRECSLVQGFNAPDTEMPDGTVVPGAPVNAVRACEELETAYRQAGIELRAAQEARAALNAPTDLSALQANLTNAQQTLADAQANALPFLPVSEVVYLNTLPRRVDAVNVQRGQTIGMGSVMTVSGADLTVTATAAAADANLVTVGSVGVLELGDTEIEATVTEVEPPSPTATGAAARWTILLEPNDVTPEQANDLRNRNLRVVIPVSATGGEVLVVPLAALTAGPGGESRIEVMQPDGSTELVVVTTGLAAGGLVEVQGVARTLSAGELVVIGTDVAPAGTAAGN